MPINMGFFSGPVTGVYWWVFLRAKSIYLSAARVDTLQLEVD